MRRWYNVVVILMFVIGFALIAGSVIYYIWTVERIADKAVPEEAPRLGQPTRDGDDFRRRSQQFSQTEHPQQTEKDNEANEDVLTADSDEGIIDDETDTEAATAQENDAHEQSTDDEAPDAETSNARELYIQERGRKAIAELPQMISEWKQMTEEWSSLSRTTLPAEEKARLHADYIKNRKELEDKILRSAFDYIAATDDVDTLNAVFEGTIWSFD